MRNVSVARRYARALLDVSAEAGALDAVGEQLTSFAQFVADRPEVTDALENPGYAKEHRMAVVEALIRGAPQTQPVVANLLKVLVDNGRIALLGDISRVYRDFADAKAGRIRGKVTSAVPLSKDALQRLEQALEKVVQRDVVLEAQVDPKILGGVSAQVGSVLYDGSLRTQLEELRKSLRAR